MKFSIARDTLIKPLNLVAGVVERRQTLPILSNVLIALEGSRLSLTGTDSRGRARRPTGALRRQGSTAR